MTEEKWVFKRVDANNTFNEINRIAMLWTVRHLWPSEAHFVLNLYRHHSSLVLRRGYGKATILHSREGVTQGDPLIMVA